MGKRLRMLGKGLVTLVCVVGLVVMFGCSGFQDVIVPCHIDEEAANYADIPIISYMPWTTIWDARRVDSYMKFNHTVMQVTYQRMQEDDTLQFDFLRNNLRVNLADATQLQEQLFDPAGPIGLLIPTLCAGTLCATLISKPGDKKKITELETKLNGKTNGTV
jgi:hypothetical protein